jgi:hypothetical protein
VAVHRPTGQLEVVPQLVQLDGQFISPCETSRSVPRNATATTAASTASRATTTNRSHASTTLRSPNSRPVGAVNLATRLAVAHALLPTDR